LLNVHQALSDHRPSTFCTVCFFFVTVMPDGTQRLDLSLGGHPQPLLRRASGEVFEIGAPGTLLGIVDPSLTDWSLELAPGDTVVMYTDGLTDAPTEQAVPIEELVELIESEGAQAIQDLADSIRPLKRRRRPLGSSDDTALLIMRFGAATV
jgi:serine phosphatase RsbU (regulator of sigma subunit)